MDFIWTLSWSYEKHFIPLHGSLHFTGQIDQSQNPKKQDREECLLPRLWKYLSTNHLNISLVSSINVRILSHQPLTIYKYKKTKERSHISLDGLVRLEKWPNSPVRNGTETVFVKLFRDSKKKKRTVSKICLINRKIIMRNSLIIIYCLIQYSIRQIRKDSLIWIT